MSRGETRPATPKLPVIRPCAGPCKRMTRPSKRKVEDYPDTVTRMDGLYCRQCFYELKPDAPKRVIRDMPDEHIASVRETTERWLEARRQRLFRHMGPKLPPYVRQKVEAQ